MTTDEYNALPLEARRFIQNNAGCLSCGNSADKLTRAYELYKSQKMTNVYQLFGGGINYILEDKRGVLYNIKDGDSDFEIRQKLSIAAKIKKASPEVFISYNATEIKELLNSLQKENIVVIKK